MRYEDSGGLRALRFFHTKTSDKIAHPIPTNKSEITSGLTGGAVFVSASTLAISGLSVDPSTAEADAVGARVGVDFGVGVGVFAGVWVGVLVGVTVGEGVGVLVGAGVGVAVGPITVIVVSLLHVGEPQLEVYLPTLNK